VTGAAPGVVGAWERRRRRRHHRRRRRCRFRSPPSPPQRPQPRRGGGRPRQRQPQTLPPPPWQASRHASRRDGEGRELDRRAAAATAATTTATIWSPRRRRRGEELRLGGVAGSKGGGGARRGRGGRGGSKGTGPLSGAEGGGGWLVFGLHVFYPRDHDDVCCTLQHRAFLSGGEGGWCAGRKCFVLSLYLQEEDVRSFLFLYVSQSKRLGDIDPAAPSYVFCSLSVSKRKMSAVFSLFFCVSQSKRGRSPPPPRARLGDVDPATPTRQVDTLTSARVTLTGGCVTLTGVPPVTLGPRPGPGPATIGGDTALDRTIGTGGGPAGGPGNASFLPRTPADSGGPLSDRSKFPLLQLAGAKSRTYAPDGTCTRLSVLRIPGYGTAVLPSVAPPIRGWGYYFVSLFRLFPS